MERLKRYIADRIASNTLHQMYATFTALYERNYRETERFSGFEPNFLRIVVGMDLAKVIDIMPYTYI